MIASVIYLYISFFNHFQTIFTSEMSTFVENRGTRGPPGFDLGEPDIVTDGYKYYGAINTAKHKYRKGNGITLYTDGGILECKWKSNNQIEIGTPVFHMISEPEFDDVHFYYYFDKNYYSDNIITEFYGKESMGYIVAPTHTFHPGLVSRKHTDTIHGYVFIYGRLYLRSKNGLFYIVRSGFFGNLTNEKTAIGIQIDDDFVKFGIFRFELGLGVQNELIQGYIYNKDTSDETIFGSSVLEDKSVFGASYQNYKEAQKNNPKKNFKKFVQPPPLQSFSGLKAKLFPLPEDDNWSDEEDTKIVRAFVDQVSKKHCQ